MPRDLSITPDNTITLIDPVSKSEVAFHYRTPTTSDRMKYMASRFKRTGNTLVDRTKTATIDAAAAVLTGIRTGDFVVDGAPLSSTPGAAEYRPEWKELVKNAAGDLLYLMGYDLFEGTISLPDEMKDIQFVGEFDGDATAEATEAPQPEAIPPLAKNSGD